MYTTTQNIADMDVLEERVVASKKDNYYFRKCRQWWQIGKKDGLCDIMRPLKEIPVSFRGHYNAGHTYGMLCNSVGNGLSGEV